MALLRRTRRTAISRSDLLIVILIVIVLVGLFIHFLNKASDRGVIGIACSAKMREIGLACKNYESTYGFLPCEKPKSTTSVFWAIREEMEIFVKDENDKSPVPQFLCPSRRSAQSVNGPYSDYGFGDHPSKFSGEGHSVLAGSDKVTSKMIEESGGMRHTLLVSHLGLKPKDYLPGGGPWDVHWKTGPLKRNPLNFIHDSDDKPMAEYLGAPHPTVSPCLFADGSVRRLGYDVPGPILGALWSYDVKKTIPDEYQGK